MCTGLFAFTVLSALQLQCALKRESLASESESYVGQNYEASLLADIPGVPSSKWSVSLRICLVGHAINPAGEIAHGSGSRRVQSLVVAL